MKKIFNRNYLYKVWLSSIFWSAIFSTFAFIIYAKLDNQQFSEVIAFFLVSLLLIGAFSWFLFLVCHFITRYMPHDTTVQRKKIKRTIFYISGIGMIGSCIFWGIRIGRFTEELLIPLCLFLGITTATAITPVEKYRDSLQDEWMDDQDGDEFNIEDED